MSRPSWYPRRSGGATDAAPPGPPRATGRGWFAAVRPGGGTVPPRSRSSPRRGSVDGLAPGGKSHEQVVPQKVGLGETAAGVVQRLSHFFGCHVLVRPSTAIVQSGPSSWSHPRRNSSRIPAAHPLGRPPSIDLVPRKIQPRSAGHALTDSQSGCATYVGPYGNFREPDWRVHGWSILRTVIARGLSCC